MNQCQLKGSTRLVFFFLECQRGQKGGAELAIIPIPTTRYVFRGSLGVRSANRGIGTDLGTPLVALNIVMDHSVVLHVFSGDRNVPTMFRDNSECLRHCPRPNI